MAKKTKPRRAPKLRPREVWKNVPVAHVQWTAEFWPALRDIHRNRNGKRKRLNGQCIFKKRLLRVDDSMSPEAQVLTFFHEWLHAWHYVNGYEAGEAKVEGLAQGMAGLLVYLQNERHVTRWS